jgi:chromosome segregation ATPase
MITRIHLKDVKGVSGSFDLGKVTNLIGPNGSGKSAILDGIKLGLTGYTDLGKLAGKTFQLASGKSMEVSLESAMGRSLARKFERSGSGAKQTIMLNGEVVPEKDLDLPVCFRYPVEAIHPSEFLNLSDEKRADYVFSALPEEINSISPEEIDQKLPFFTQKTSFSELLETLKSKKLELEKEIKRCIANIQKLTGEIGEVPAGNLNEWEEKKKTAAAELEKVTGEISANEERAKLASSKSEQLARLQKNITESSQKITDTTKSIARLQDCITKVPEARNMAILEMEKLKLTKAATIAKAQKIDLEAKLETLKTKGCCPFCNALAVALEDSMDQWELQAFNLGTETEELEASLAEIDADINQARESARITAANDDAQRQIRVDQDALKRYQIFHLENVQAFEKLNGDNDQAPVSMEILRGKAEGLRLQVREADEAIRKFIAVQSVRNQKSKSESERLELEKSLDTIKAALDSVKAFRDTRLIDATVSLAHPFGIIVNAAFGCPSFLALISENDKPCFRFGIVRNDQEIGFDTLSGGEKTIMLTALVACLQIIRTGTPGIGLFELAEADANSVKGLIDAAEKVGFEQIIIASCHGQPIDGAVNITMGVQQS